MPRPIPSAGLGSIAAAFIRATFTASTRLIWPAPIASVRSALVKMTVFDLTCAQSRHANRSACHSCRRRLAFRHDVKIGRRPRDVRLAHRVAGLHEHTANNRAKFEVLCGRYSASAVTRSGTTTRMLALVARIARASSSTEGAITASMRRGHDRARRFDVDRTIQCHCSAEGRERVGLARAHIGIGGTRSGRGTARVRVLDERGGRFA